MLLRVFAFFLLFVLLLLWLHRQGERRRRRARSHHKPMIPPAPPGCNDFNASCLSPCRQCLQLAADGCEHCSRFGLPKCIEAPVNFSVDTRVPVRWLHFPKCGATLGVSVLSYACLGTMPTWHTVGMALRGGRVDVRMAHAIGARHANHGSRCGGRLLLPFDGHRPVSDRIQSDGPSNQFAWALPKTTLRDTHGLIAFFRRPAQRLISAYLDNLHAWGLKSSERARLKHRVRSIAAFARHPGIAGCMAKMLAGFQCAARVDLPTSSIVKAALAVLRSSRFLFVGLTEEWDASICLLHRVLPGHTRPLLAEFRSLGHSTNVHRFISWLPPSSVDGLYNESVLHGFVDDADEAVYLEAKRIFRSTLARVQAGEPHDRANDAMNNAWQSAQFSKQW